MYYGIVSPTKQMEKRAKQSATTWIFPTLKLNLNKKEDKQDLEVKEGEKRQL